METYTLYSERSGSYALETHQHRVEVWPYFLPERSVPNAPHYFYAYRVTITNLASDFVSRLIERKWVIRDGRGVQQEIEGPGVVGVTPLLRPKESFTYASFCPLVTPTGSMRGIYTLRSEKDLRTFSIVIPLFFLRPDLPVFHYEDSQPPTPQS